MLRDEKALVIDSDSSGGFAWRQALLTDPRSVRNRTIVRPQPLDVRRRAANRTAVHPKELIFIDDKRAIDNCTENAREVIAN